MKVCLDVETSTHNKGHPFDKRNFLVSYALKPGTDNVSFSYYTDPDFISCLNRAVTGATELVGFNIKFDLHWLQRVGVTVPMDCRIWDCSLAEYLISGQTASFVSLNDTLKSYGEDTKPDMVASYWEQGISTEDIPVPILEEYNKYDVEGTAALQVKQQGLMTSELINFCYLMGEDLKAIQHAEYHGIKFDTEKADQRVVEYTQLVDACEQRLNDYLPDLPDGVRFNWDSGDQLSAFLYGGIIKYEYSIPETATYKSGPRKDEVYTKNRWFSSDVTFLQRFRPLEGTEVAKTKSKVEGQVHFYQTDAPTLSQLQGKKSEAKDILLALKQRSAYIKVVEMINSIKKKMNDMHWDDHYLHPQFNQNVVVTGRLSSSSPNVQNAPIEVDELLVSRYD